ncbi:hypothetical protein FHX12_005989 [Rhizobium sp. BK609]|nr:hypothetical protein [Rhizobium sp. BK098]MBB3618959.1 hypothetical protein [Rhizobium sp. BK609]MBB3684615.1 hypothetical protein [Rhizobium sp. BK612]
MSTDEQAAYAVITKAAFKRSRSIAPKDRDLLIEARRERR